jgi:deoxyribodipyrimidine photolyase-related protein
LVDDKLRPQKGKWTFDKQNRIPYSKSVDVPDQTFKKHDNEYVKEAKRYIDKYFKNNIGETDYYLPIDHDGTKKHFKKFLKEKLNCFGKYQDIACDKVTFGCHSILSPLINIGLITPSYIIKETIRYYEKNKNKIPYESLEGFVRQILGWRETMRMLYVHGHKKLIESNHFKHDRKLDKTWYTGNTGVYPIDVVIKKVLKYGYAHHIERLMHVGNFMLLSKINPKDVYNWFMICFIDGYEWVMETNVYAMSQWSTGPLLTGRPYFSSSNYIDKMSCYKRKEGVYDKIKIGDEYYEWFELWDALYYNFVNDNKKEFSKNYATASSVAHLDNKGDKEKNKIFGISKKYFNMYG